MKKWEATSKVNEEISIKRQAETWNLYQVEARNQKHSVTRQDNRTQQRLSKFVLSVESVLLSEVFLFYDNEIMKIGRAHVW
jgi:hypothetical protein